MKRRVIVFSTVSLASALFGATAVPAATTCEGLVNLSLQHGQVTAAQTITGGTFNTPPGCTTGSTGCTTNAGLPQFCRVAGTATPTNDSIINFEVWIPTDGSFNGKGTVNLSHRRLNLRYRRPNQSSLQTATADFGPDLEFLGPGGSVLGGSDMIAAEMEEVVDLIVG